MILNQYLKLTKKLFKVNPTLSYKIFKLSFSTNNNNQLLDNYLNFCNRWYSTFIKTFTLDLMVILWAMSKKLYGRFMVDDCIVVFYIECKFMIC